MHRPALATLALLAATLSGCGVPLRSTEATRYQGMLLNARNLGADELARQTAADPTIARYVAQHGTPDFLLNGGPTDVQLVYAGRSVLAYFRRPEAGAPSTVYEVTPLPSGLLQMLPSDLRAGTAPPLNPAGPNCWTVPAGTRSCRTCCQGTAACVVQCRTSGH
jgi:hypothetical protein